MKTAAFNFALPEEFIAQTPLEKRDNSKLLVLDKETGTIIHSHFNKIITYLNKGDVLVRNNTKVLPARLIGEKESTKAHIELLLLNNKEDIWECLVKPARKVTIGDTITFGNGILKAECIFIKDSGIKKFKMIYKGIFLEVLDQLGEMPLPPYIYKKLEDKNRYQTIYAKEPGSAAAPTAGLHFTRDVLEEITKKGVIIVDVTLHIGFGTFKPVIVEEVTNHKMHNEYYKISKETAEILNKAKHNENKIISVGTTSTRVLETNYLKHHKFKEDSGWTNIFIYPGFKFQAIDNLITNFHLPKSTLLMLVSALANKKIIMKAYEEAIKKEYRFFSFGDSMFIK